MFKYQFYKCVEADFKELTVESLKYVGLRLVVEARDVHERSELLDSVLFGDSTKAS